MDKSNTFGLLKRHISRRSMSILPTGLGKGRKIVMVALVLSLGFFCGSIIHHLFRQRRSNDNQPDSQHHIRDIQNDFLTNDDLELNELIRVTREQLESRDSVVHVQDTAKDSATKRDTTVDPRSILPSKVFVNCGGTFPRSLDLFFSTYPKFYEYISYTFLPDASYSVFYNKFPNHTLFAPVIGSNKNSTNNVITNDFASMMTNKEDVKTLDIADWLKTFTSRDDYVILKLEKTEKEPHIISKIVENGAVNWVDKFYTTATDERSMAIYSDNLDPHNKHVFVWDEIGQTYADFEHLNTPHVPPGGEAIMSKCFNHADTAQFALLLYSQHFTLKVKVAIQSLLSYAGDRKIAVSLFLPLDFFSFNDSLTRMLLQKFNVGLYLSEFQAGENVTDRLYNRYRNRVVKAGHLVKRSTRATHALQMVMTSPEVSDLITLRLAKERHVTIFNKAKDISGHTESVLGNVTLTMDAIGRRPGQYLAVDLNTMNSDMLSLYMVKRFEPWLIPALKCEAQANNKSSKTTKSTG